MIRAAFFVIPFFALSILADPATPASVAALVQAEESALPAPLTEALRSPEPLVRATAARVIAIRGLTQLLPLVREVVATETDATAAREAIRALALLGAQDDVDFAVTTASRWPQGMDDAVAVSIARRGGVEAIDRYVSALRKTRMSNHAEFFRLALWGESGLAALTGSRIVGAADAPAWRGLLAALTDSSVAMSPGVMASSLGSSSEEIRAASVWSLVRGYAADPSLIADVVKDKLAPRDELSSNREDFGRELLHRMIGGGKKDDARWLKFLESGEADELFQGQDQAFQYLTDAEYGVRYNRCEVQSRECAMPKKRSRFAIPSQPVAPPAFNLPEVLPAGLSDAIVSAAQCRGPWLGVGSVTVDRAGRIRTLDLGTVSANAPCKRALATLLGVSMATNTSIRSGFSGPALLVHPARNPLCLDEDLEPGAAAPFRAGGNVEPPKPIKRVEPQFPSTARHRMAGGQSVLVIVESVISKSGCVRSLRIVEQSPFPEINGAVLMALSQWKFRPGYLDGKPVDVLFNVTTSFKVQ